MNLSIIIFCIIFLILLKYRGYPQGATCGTKSRTYNLSKKLERSSNYDSESINIIYYYMATCPYCIEFEPIYNSIYNSINNINFIKIDIKTPQSNENLYINLYNKLNLMGVPSIIKITNSNIYIYNGNRTYKDLKEWILN